ncbi:hypothetical protein PLICRDRAFT_224253 [Plicaturopsis crispa FD-325 SS-3]|nr:hypothetical protein PLICRDRAFT_224253 [Plicaturopsis crispa FD-325 SS-3]
MDGFQNCQNCGTPVARVSDTIQFTSKVAELLRTNTFPNATQAQIVRLEIERLNACIALTETETARIDAEIKRLHKSRERLKTSRKSLERSLVDHSVLATATVIRVFPPELLAQILVESLDTDDCSDTASMIRSRWPLVRVCKYWRQVALTTQKLWSSMVVSLNGHRLSPLLERWLKRSGQHPLTMVFEAQYPSWDNSAVVCEPLVDALVPHSSRWQDVTFKITHSPWINNFRMLQGHLPVLRALTVQFDYPAQCDWESEEEMPLATASEMQSGFLDVFREAPLLRDISVPAIFLSFTPTPMPMPWPQVTFLSVRACDGENSIPFLTILRHFPNLTNCTLDFRAAYINRSTAEAVLIPTTHLRLQSLCIKYWYDKYLPGVFDHCSLPALRVLELVNCGHLGSTFPLLLARSQCFIQTFVFSPVSSRYSEEESSSYQSLMECVELMTSLTQLHITALLHATAYHEQIDWLFAYLALPPESEPSTTGLPNLKRLELRLNYDDCPISVSPIADIICRDVYALSTPIGILLEGLSVSSGLF